MPQRTALRRVSTVVVGVLFAVVFVCSGASAGHTTTKNGKAAADIHTASSKAVARAIDVPLAKHHDLGPLLLATTPPSTADEAQPAAAERIAERVATAMHVADIATSDRAPPAH